MSQSDLLQKSGKHMLMQPSGPLSGVRVLDLTQVLSGPFCTQILGDLGAEIIKVEPPSGDGTRKWGPPFLDGESAYFLSLNRNKQSIVIDLKKGKEASEVIKRMSEKCDVFIENFRPGVLRKLGLSYDEISKRNPRIVYCSISGYGQTGPLSRKPGYDLAAFAASGIMSLTGERSGPPVKAGVPVADIGAGMFAAIAICSMLSSKRVRDGKGCYIDISLYDSMISWLTFQAGSYFATGENPVALGSAHPIIAPYQAFKASDRFFILAVGNDAQWVRMCKSIQNEKLARDPRFLTNSDRITHREELESLLSKIFQTRRASYWLRVFDKAGVPCSPINTVEEALKSRHTSHRKLIFRLRHPKAGYIRCIATPIKLSCFDQEMMRIRRRPPLLGEHSREILLRFGFTKSEVTLLTKKFIVQ